jgi:hypothetical protein
LDDVKKEYGDWRGLLDRIELVNQTNVDTDLETLKTTISEITANPDFRGVKLDRKVTIVGPYEPFWHGGTVAGVFGGLAVIMTVVHFWMLVVTVTELDEKKRIEYFESKRTNEANDFRKRFISHLC